MSVGLSYASVYILHELHIFFNFMLLQQVQMAAAPLLRNLLGLPLRIESDDYTYSSTTVRRSASRSLVIASLARLSTSKGDFKPNSILRSLGTTIEAFRSLRLHPQLFFGSLITCCAALDFLNWRRFRTSARRVSPRPRRSRRERRHNSAPLPNALAEIFEPRDRV